MKIGFIRTSSIGDVVLASACLDYLRLSSPTAEVVWVGRSPTLEFFKQCEGQITTFELSRKMSSIQKTEMLKALQSCQLIVDLQTTFRSKAICRHVKAQGVPVYFAHKYKWKRALLVARSWLFGRLLKPSMYAKGSSQLQYKMMLEALHDALKSKNAASIDAFERARPRLTVGETDLDGTAWSKECSRELAHGHWIAVAPGASHETKRAPTEIFKDVLNQVQLNCGKDFDLPGILLLGGSEDRAASVELTDQLNWQGPVLNLAGKLSLIQTKAAVSKVKCLLSNDSGLSHIAEAVGIPVAVLFGPTSEQFGFGPQLPESQAFSSTLGCRPCSKHGKQKCRYKDQLCFRSIDTRAVASFLVSVLGKGRPT